MRRGCGDAIKSLRCEQYGHFIINHVFIYFRLGRVSNFNSFHIL